MANNDSVAFAQYTNSGGCNVVPCIVQSNGLPVWISDRLLEEGQSTTIKLDAPNPEGPNYTQNGTTFHLGYKVQGVNPNNTTWNSQVQYGFQSQGGTAHCEFTGSLYTGNCVDLATTDP